MGGADEDWVKSAMTDDAMVVELLVRLHRTAPPPPPPPLKPAALPLEWSVRQRRSKYVSTNNNPNKPGHRGSPTTPLSWSGATSFSGGSGGARGGGGSEESSRASSVKLCNATRSKVNGDGEKSGSKKSRKKKTLVELKEEENLLVKERRELKREIAALRVNLEKQRTTNESLKRMKLELEPHMDSGKPSLPEEPVSCQVQPKVTISLLTPPAVISVNEMTPANGCPERNGASDSKFVLPDLNIPFEDPCSDVVCGVS